MDHRVPHRRYSIAPEVDFLGYLNYLEDKADSDNYHHPPRNYQSSDELCTMPYSNTYSPNHSINFSPPSHPATSSSPPNLSPPMNYTASYQNPPYTYYNY